MHDGAYTLNLLEAPHVKVFSVLRCIPPPDAVVNIWEKECFLRFRRRMDEHLCCEARGARRFVFPIRLRAARSSLGVTGSMVW